jgi:hypothetical protein
MNPFRLNGLPSLNDSEEHDDKGNGKQDMDKITHRVTAY